MTSLSIKKTDIEGFAGYRVQTGALELTLLPELGGKVSSLRDSRTGREWLWRHPRYPYKRVPHMSSYIAEADTGGWDECFPSVAQCSYPSSPWEGAGIQDHGELWSQSPEFELQERADLVTLRTRWQGIALPYTFTRTLTLSSNSSRIHADYEVVNDSDSSIHYVWCIHPLLAIEPGMDLLLPSAARFNVGGSIPAELASTQTKLTYPFAASGLTLPALPHPSIARAIKIWSDPLPPGEGWAEVRASDGGIRLSWDVAVLPQVAAWMNLGAWAADGGEPYYNLGLEPCIGAQDSLEDAVKKYELFATLPPRGSNTWWLDIELTES